MKRDRIIVKCQQCGRKFETRPYLINVRNRGKYCSQKCYWKSKIGKKRNLVELECDICGRLFFRNQCFIRKKSKLHFCGKKCVGKYNQIRMVGSNNWNWKGGVKKRSTNDANYREWRKAIFERDNYTCQKCKTRGNKTYLQPHHIKGWAKYPELRYELSNGITLCIDCHLRGKLHCK